MKRRSYILRVLPLLLLAVAGLSFMQDTRVYADCPDNCDWPWAGRDFWQGYLTGKDLQSGDSSRHGMVWGPEEAPWEVDSAEEYIDWMQPFLFDTSNGSFNDHTGAATYIVTSMLGDKGPDFNNDFMTGVNSARARWDEWKRLVHYYDDRGWVNWSSFEANCSPYVQANLDYIEHDIYYYVNTEHPDCLVEESIVFYNPNTDTHFEIKKSCGNPVGKNHLLTPGLEYKLDPIVKTSATVAVPGEQVTFSYSVYNEGPGTSPPVDWQIRQRTISGDAQERGAEDNANPADRGGTEETGKTVYQLSPPEHPANDGNASGVYNKTVTITGEPGQKVCRSLGVDPAGQGVRNRYSAERCILIAKRPTVHFMGGDISVGSPYRSDQADCATRHGTGGIYTIANDDDNGSVVEYASFTRGLIEFRQSLARGFGTGSRPGTDVNRVAQLGFANTDGDNVGGFDDGRCMPDYYAKYSARIPAQASPGSRSFGGTERVHYHGNLTIDTSDIQNGASILVIVDGDVIITGDIRYSGSYGATSEIPSFAVVSGGNIRVRDTVQQMDGVFVSKGTLNTCGNGPARLSTNVCNQQLGLNGVIITDQLRLRRTFGAKDSNKRQPAEKFNYTTELFFNNVLADGGGDLETMEQQDLPPRY